MIFWLEIILLVLLIILLLTLCWQMAAILFRQQAPYIISGSSVIKQAIGDLQLPEPALVYELGCGDAPFLRALTKIYPQARGLGVDNYIWPYIFAKMFNLFNRRIKIIKKSIYKVDLSQADLIYCYLNLASMAKLEPKFLRECKNDVQVISYNFPLPHVEPYKVLRIKVKPVYFYKLNTNSK